MEVVVLLTLLLSTLFLFFMGRQNIKTQRKAMDEQFKRFEEQFKGELNLQMIQNRQESLLLTQEYIRTMSQNLLASIQSSTQQMESRQQALERAVTTQVTQLNHRLEALLSQNQQQLESIRKTLEERLTILGEDHGRNLHQMRQTLETLREQSNQSNEQIRVTVQERLESMQKDNSLKLDQMRQTVDEKLQNTLNERLTQSFELVNRQLEQVHKGLGEMQTLAVGVGDLKKVLSNVKTRGILGEIQLEAILEQILSQEQYQKNVVTRPNSRNPVEFAVVLPGDNQQKVLLPIDSKFPMEPYHRLLEAYDTGSAEAVAIAYKQLEQAIKLQAKTIHEKYIEPPYTTDFAILFLPIEGLYAEVVRHGLIESLQRDYKINIAGPTTMAALLNSLQMGFRTLAIQKRSSEVWNTLSSVKLEFARFGEVLEATQVKLRRAGDDLEKLIGTRTKAIIRRLKDVELLEQPDSEIALLDPPESKE